MEVIDVGHLRWFGRVGASAILAGARSDVGRVFG
jgi:hypothetical protein